MFTTGANTIQGIPARPPAAPSNRLEAIAEVFNALNHTNVPLTHIPSNHDGK